MHTKLILAFSGTALFSAVTAEDATSPGERKVRNCDMGRLPRLADGAVWDCKGNSCGVSCASEGTFYKNQMFCNRKTKWEVSSAIPIKDITCDRFPRNPKFDALCDINSAPTSGANGVDAGSWSCDKRYRRCKLACENSHKAKTQLTCVNSAWEMSGKNTCTPPVPRVCDHNAVPSFGEGEITCRRGKSCNLKCNNHVIQGALRCKAGVWEKKNPDMVCCSNASRPSVANGDWKCKDKKFTSVCKLQCDNGKKGRTLMRCEANAWEMYGNGTC